MKKRIVLLLVLAFLLALTGCHRDLPAGGTEMAPSAGSVDEHPTPVPDVVTVVDIIDRTQIEPLLTADALEGFWHDEEYTYYFGSIKSHYVIVHYSDGTTQPVTEALAEGRVTMADLDRFGIGYWKEPRIYITDIVDRDTMDTAVDVFFTGIDYYYYFPTIHETTVYYSDGTQQPLKEAMSELRVTIEDLDRFGIGYSKAPMREVAEMEYREGVLTALEHFWSDEVYDYYFSCMGTEVTVIFTDGTQMELREALELGFVSIYDLDRFDILYYREPKE